MKTKVTYQNRIGQWLVLFLFFLTGVMPGLNRQKFNEDSLKTKFDINDPRNPDCPCHKFQKMADDEFNRLNKGVSFKAANNENEPDRGNRNPQQKLPNRSDTFEGRSFFSEKGLHKKHNKSFFRHKHHTRLKKHPLFHKIFNVKDWDVWKRVTDPTACYRWRS